VLECVIESARGILRRRPLLPAEILVENADVFTPVEVGLDRAILLEAVEVF
jgi:hypothetical protein